MSLVAIAIVPFIMVVVLWAVIWLNRLGKFGGFVRGIVSPELPGQVSLSHFFLLLFAIPERRYDSSSTQFTLSNVPQLSKEDQGNGNKRDWHEALSLCLDISCVLSLSKYSFKSGFQRSDGCQHFAALTCLYSSRLLLEFCTGNIQWLSRIFHSPWMEMSKMYITTLISPHLI